jgi:hypothetical protein
MITNKYDIQIQEAAHQWLPEWDWLWLKAQLYKEGVLDESTQPNISKGLWEDIVFKLRFPATAKITDVEYSIPAVIYYIAVLRNAWGSPRTEDERRKLTQTSYITSFDEIKKLLHVCGDNAIYNDIVPKLSKRVVNYINSIKTTYSKLKEEEKHAVE